MVNQLLAQIQQAESTGTLAPIIDWSNDIDLNMTVGFRVVLAPEMDMPIPDVADKEKED